MTLLIDGYSLIYRGYFAFVNNPRVTSGGLNTSALLGFCNLLGDLVLKRRPQHAVVCLDAGAKTFRNDLFPAYKATRDKQPEGITDGLPYIRRLLQALGLTVAELPGFEADDLLGTLAWRFATDGHNVTLVTSDKDCAQLVNDRVTILAPRTGGPAETLDPKGVKDKYGVQPAQMADLLALMGDASDNIPGCRGVGPKTAVALLAEYHTLEGVLDNIDKLKGAVAKRLAEGRDDVRLSRQLTGIRRDAPIELTYEQSACKPIDWPALEALFEVTEMTATYKRWQRMLTDVANDGGQPQTGSLFAEPAPKLLLGVVSGVATDHEEIDGVMVCRDLKAFFKEQGTRNKEHSAGEYFDLSLAAALLHPGRRETLYAGDLRAQYESLRRNLAAEPDTERLYREVELPLVPVLAHMEMVGALIDSERLLDYGQELRHRMESLAQEGAQLAGGPFNMRSTQQTATLLFERLGIDPKAVGAKKTKGGKWATNEETLTKIKEQGTGNKEPGEGVSDSGVANRLVELILEYRGLSKLVGTYAEALPKLCDAEGRVHTTYNQALVVTGRLSSSNPNLQNIPVREEQGRRIRECFVAPAGSRLVSADYSQVELRILAHFSADEALREAFRQGLDVHRATAAKIYGVQPEAVSDEQRRHAKTANFGIIYGISAHGLSVRLGIPRQEAQALIDGYFRAYPGVQRYMAEAIAQARASGYATTLYGRRRRIADIDSRNQTQRGLAERTAINTPIQGTAADIMKLAMVRAYHRLRAEAPEARIILQVHDELVVECPAEQAQQVAQILQAEMQGAAQLAVPLTVDVGVGSNWLQAH